MNKRLITLIILLFLPIITHAITCPSDKPLQDINGTCFSCASPLRTKVLTSSDCRNVCPDRLVFSDGRFTHCAPNTISYRILLQLSWPGALLIVFSLFLINLVILVYLQKKFYESCIKKQFVGKTFLTAFTSLVLGIFFNIVLGIFILQFPNGILYYAVLLPIIWICYRIICSIKNKFK